MKIVVFNHSFFYLSETFIYRQLTGLSKDIEATLLAFGFMNESHFPTPNKKVELKRTANMVDKLISRMLPERARTKLGFSLLNYLTVRKLLRKSGTELIHAHFGFNAATIFPLAKALNLPLIISFHGLDASPQMLKDEKYRRMVQEMIRFARAIIVVSPHMIDTLELGPWQHKTYLIPYGVSAAEFTNSSPAPGGDRVIILHSGRLVAKKGVPDLIRACLALIGKGYPVQLNIIGDGPELQACKEVAGDAEYIRFLGAQPQETVKTSMSGADIFVLNSRTSEAGDMEGLPNAILEAMSMRLPVVSTYHAGIPQAIQNDVNGLLVQENDTAGLQQALERLLNDKGLRQRLGEAARQTVEKEFSFELMNKKIAAVYDAIRETLPLKMPA